MKQETQPQPELTIKVAQSLMSKEAELEPTLETLQEVLKVRIDLQVLFLDKAFANLTDVRKQQLNDIANRYLQICIEAKVSSWIRDEEKAYHTLFY